MKKTSSIFENIEPKSVHFIGIGGIGVSSLAYWFRSQSLDKLGIAKGKKWVVSGSDSAKSKITLDLKKDRLKVKIGHKKANLPAVGRFRAGLVIYSNAIRPENPELMEARRLGIPTFSYPEAVGVLTRRYRTFGVAGAHGKSTTTSLLSLILIKAGWDPTVIVGTKLKEFRLPTAGRRGDRNFRLGKSDYLVLESDEWKGAFWNYSPFGAIITNIDREHLDFYENFGNVKKSFLKYVGNIQTGGILVANRDDKKLLSLKREIEKITKRNGVNIIWYSVDKNPRMAARLKKNLSIPGRHNLENAMAVYILARNLGIPENKVLSALKSYRGAWRRMEYRGELRIKNGELRVKNKHSLIHNSSFIIPVYDDYAHHPTEIKATLQAFREKFPKEKIICVFQPHQAHRLKALFGDFTRAFRDADTLILLPSYKVAGRDVQNKKYTSETLGKKIKGAIYCKNPRSLKGIIKNVVIQNSPSTPSSGPRGKFIIHNSVLVMMGAGTVVEYTDELLKKFR